MRLRDLGAEFVKIVSVDDGADEYGQPKTQLAFTTEGVTLESAQGVMFLCPACFAKNGGARGTHMIVCWSRSRGAPDGMSPAPGRWKLEGTGVDDLSLLPDVGGNGNKSVQMLGGCNAHFHVEGGEIRMC